MPREHSNGAARRPGVRHHGDDRQTTVRGARVNRHVYRCPRCGTDSPPYALRALADAHADDHRRRHHGGDHPIGEAILTEPGPGLRDVSTGQWIATALLVAFILATVLMR